jgi:hypothetical protein
MSLKHALPPMYAQLLPPFFDAPAPAEEKATCNTCVMCPPPGVTPPVGVEYFRPDTKCCTYHPTLANYLVGALLADPDPALAEGQRRVRDKIARGIGATPRWLHAPQEFQEQLAARREREFGRALDLRCPFYVEDGGLCSIWRYREGDCSTFFCKFDAGADGRIFWRTLTTWLARTEVALSKHALDQVAPELGDIAWGEWAGREEELYRRCHEVVRGVRDLKAIMGEEHDQLLAQLQSAYQRATSDQIPLELVRAADLPLAPVEGGAIAIGYSKYEPLFLSDAVLEALGEQPLDLPDELRRVLYRARIIVEPHKD